MLMSDDDFEWDEAKAAFNYAKHRVRFIAARAAFKDVFAVGGEDDRHDYGEERFYIIGMVDGRLLRSLHRASRHHSNNLGASSRTE